MNSFEFMNLRLQVALYQARNPVEDSEPGSPVPVLASLGDLDLLPGELVTPETGNGRLVMEDDQDLALALSVATDSFGLQNTAKDIADKVLHEVQHADAICYQGLLAVHSVLFKVMGHGGVGMKVTTSPVGSEITKLGYASMIAHPHRLSNSDIRQLGAIGYEGPLDVARHIQATGTDLLMPLSTAHITT